QGLTHEMYARAQTKSANLFVGFLENRRRNVDSDAIIAVSRHASCVVTDSAPGVEHLRAGRRLDAPDDPVHDEVIEVVETRVATIDGFPALVNLRPRIRLVQSHESHPLSATVLDHQSHKAIHNSVPSHPCRTRLLRDVARCVHPALGSPRLGVLSSRHWRERPDLQEGPIGASVPYREYSHCRR